LIFKFGSAELTSVHRGDWTGLNFAYAVITEIFKEKYKAAINGRPQGGEQNGHLPPWKVRLIIKIF